MENTDLSPAQGVELARKMIDSRELAALLGLCLVTVQMYMTLDNGKYRHRLPSAFKLPGSRRWSWWLDEVLAWRESGTRVPVPPPPGKSRGRPRGSTVRAMRAQREAARAAQRGTR